MTPMEIEMLLCVHGSRTPEANMPSVRWNSPGGKEFQQRMLTLGLATMDGIEWQSSERLKAYVAHLCAQPLPVQVWVIPSNMETTHD